MEHHPDIQSRVARKFRGNILVRDRINMMVTHGSIPIKYPPWYALLRGVAGLFYSFVYLVFLMQFEYLYHTASQTFTAKRTEEARCQGVVLYTETGKNKRYYCVNK